MIHSIQVNDCNCVDLEFQYNTACSSIVEGDTTLPGSAQSTRLFRLRKGMLEDGIAASAEALKMRRRIPVLGDDHIDTKRRMEVRRSLLKRLLENRS